MKTWVEIDLNTGVVLGVTRGERVVPQPGWVDVTEDPKKLDLLNGLDSQRRYKLVDGLLTEKPQCKLRLSRKIILADGHDVLPITLEGDDPGHPVEVTVNGKPAVLEVHGEPLFVTSTVQQRLRIKITDNRVYVPHRAPRAFAKRPPRADEGRAADDA